MDMKEAIAVSCVFDTAIHQASPTDLSQRSDFEEARDDLLEHRIRLVKTMDRLIEVNREDLGEVLYQRWKQQNAFELELMEAYNQAIGE